MMQKFPYNPGKCTVHLVNVFIDFYRRRSLRSQRRLKLLISLDKLIGGFSCVNTRLGFDSKLLLPKISDGKSKENLKIIYKIGNEDKRVVSKILKMDENNQYGYAMTKPLPT